MGVGGQRNRLRQPTFLHSGAESCPGMPCVAHAPHYRRERRSRVRRRRFDGRFKENHDSSFKEIQSDAKRGVDFEERRSVTWEAPALLPDCSPMVASLPCLKENVKTFLKPIATLKHSPDLLL